MPRFTPLPIGDASLLDSLPYARVVQIVLGIAVAGAVVGAVMCYASHRYLPVVKHGWMSWLLYVAFAATVGVLAATSLQAVFSGRPLAEYALMGHVSAAGAFTFLLVAIAWRFLPHLGLDGEFHREHRWWMTRWSSWLLILASLMTAGTMFLSMLPVLDTAGLHQVLTVHRYTGLATVVFIMFHAGALIVTRLGIR